MKREVEKKKGWDTNTVKEKNLTQCGAIQCMLQSHPPNIKKLFFKLFPYEQVAKSDIRVCVLLNLY